MVVDGNACEFLANRWLVDTARVVRPLSAVTEQRYARIGTAHHAALERQRHAHHLPSAVYFAEYAVVADTHVVVERGVRALCCHGVHRVDTHTRRIHRQQEHRETAMSWQRCVGASQQNHPPRFVRHRGPHLGTVDDPLVAVAGGASSKRREVAASVGLAVAQTDQGVAGGDRRDDRRLLLSGAHVLDDASDHHRHRQRIEWCPSFFHLVEQHPQLDWVASAEPGHRSLDKTFGCERTVQRRIVERARCVLMLHCFGGVMSSDDFANSFSVTHHLWSKLKIHVSPALPHRRQTVSANPNLLHQTVC